jgi:hypothetical protein
MLLVMLQDYLKICSVYLLIIFKQVYCRVPVIKSRQFLHNSYREYRVIFFSVNCHFSG